MSKLHPMFEDLDIDLEMKKQLSEAFEQAVLENLKKKLKN